MLIFYCFFISNSRYSRYSKNDKYISITEKFAEDLFTQFPKKIKSHTFCSGLSGILYLSEFLRENDFIDIDVSNLQSLLDNYLVMRMKYDMQQQYYDFMHGALGVGLYFLKKGANLECIRELIDFLYQTSEKEGGNKFFKWKSIIDRENNHIGYNLSLSHGISSIIIFLSRAVICGIKDEKVIKMLHGAVRYILIQQNDFMQLGFYFPPYISTNSHTPVSKSRLAWCYGDLGIGVALWQAGKAIDNSDWKEKGIEVLLQSTRRHKYEDCSVVDAGICHGSVGIAMIYHRMYLETGKDEFFVAINQWLNQSLNMAVFEDGLAGYMTFERDEWACDYSLLSGISGIGMVLMSIVTEDKPVWDEMFLIS